MPAGPLSHAAKAAVPSYDQLLNDRDQGGDLVEYMRDNPTPEIALGTVILDRQQELSKPSRRLATAACFLAFFAGGGALTDKTLNELDKDIPSLAQTDTRDHLEPVAIVGTLAGTLGGFIGSFSGLAFAGRLARWPAQKQVRQAAKSSNV